MKLVSLVFSQSIIHARTCMRTHFYNLPTPYKGMFHLSNFDNKFQNQEHPHEKKLF